MDMHCVIQLVQKYLTLSRQSAMGWMDGHALRDTISAEVPYTKYLTLSRQSTMCHSIQFMYNDYITKNIPRAVKNASVNCDNSQKYVVRTTAPSDGAPVMNRPASATAPCSTGERSRGLCVIYD